MRKKISILTVILFLTVGCAVKPLPPTKRYRIKSDDIKIKSFSKPVGCDSINISFVDSDDKIMSKDIIYVKGLEKNRYYFSKWFETPNLMLTKLLFQSVKKSGICKNVYYMMDDLNPKYTLNSKILEFDQVFDNNSSYAVADILFYIVDGDSNIIAEKEFRVFKKSPSNDAAGGVKSLSSATNDIIEKTLSWMRNSMQRANR
ncbi:MAG: hypothetical protein GXO12_01950 [Epsilonproteobacteria bacterium]|nr:hypothetical protein [Campylobacterota bacterium]